jgi:hypothetical protein
MNLLSSGICGHCDMQHGDGAAVRKAKAIQQIERVLALAEVQRTQGRYGH